MTVEYRLQVAIDASSAVEGGREFIRVMDDLTESVDKGSQKLDSFMAKEKTFSKVIMESASSLYTYKDVIKQIHGSLRGSSAALGTYASDMRIVSDSVRETTSSLSLLIQKLDDLNSRGLNAGKLKDVVAGATQTVREAATVPIDDVIATSGPIAVEELPKVASSLEPSSKSYTHSMEEYYPTQLLEEQFREFVEVAARQKRTVEQILTEQYGSPEDWVKQINPSIKVSDIEDSQLKQLILKYSNLEDVTSDIILSVTPEAVVDTEPIVEVTEKVASMVEAAEVEAYMDVLAYVDGVTLEDPASIDKAMEAISSTIGFNQINAPVSLAASVERVDIDKDAALDLAKQKVQELASDPIYADVSVKTIVKEVSTEDSDGIVKLTKETVSALFEQEPVTTDLSVVSSIASTDVINEEGALTEVTKTIYDTLSKDAVTAPVDIKAAASVIEFEEGTEPLLDIVAKEVREPLQKNPIEASVEVEAKASDVSFSDETESMLNQLKADLHARMKSIAGGIDFDPLVTDLKSVTENSTTSASSLDTLAGSTSAVSDEVKDFYDTLRASSESGNLIVTGILETLDNTKAMGESVKEVIQDFGIENLQDALVELSQQGLTLFISKMEGIKTAGEVTSVQLETLDTLIANISDSASIAQNEELNKSVQAVAAAYDQLTDSVSTNITAQIRLREAEEESLERLKAMVRGSLEKREIDKENFQYYQQIKTALKDMTFQQKELSEAELESIRIKEAETRALEEKLAAFRRNDAIQREAGNIPASQADFARFEREVNAFNDALANPIRNMEDLNIIREWSIELEKKQMISRTDLADANKVLAAAEKEIRKSLELSEEAADRLLRKYAPHHAALKELEQAERNLNLARQSGDITQDAHAAAVASITAKRYEHVQAIHQEMLAMQQLNDVSKGYNPVQRVIDEFTRPPVPPTDDVTGGIVPPVPPGGRGGSTPPPPSQPPRPPIDVAESIGGLAASMAGVAFGAAELKTAISLASEMETNLLRLQAATASSDAEMQRFSQSIRDIGDEFSKSHVEEAAAALTIASKGYRDAAENANILYASNKLADASFASLESSAAMLSQVMSAFGLEAQDAEEAAGTLNVAAYGSAEAMQSIATMAGRIGPEMKTAGLSFGDFAAAIATLQESTGGGSRGAQRAMTSFASVIERLSNITPELGVRFKDLEVNVSATRIANEGLYPVLKDIMEATGGNKDALIELMGSSKAATTVLQLMKDEGVSYAKSLERIADQQRILDETVSRNKDSFHELAGALKSELNNDLKDFGNTLKNGLVPVLKVLIDYSHLLFGALNALSTVVAVASSFKLLEKVFGRNLIAINALSNGYKTGFRQMLRETTLGTQKLAASFNILGRMLLAGIVGWEIGTAIRKQLQDSIPGFDAWMDMLFLKFEIIGNGLKGLFQKWLQAFKEVFSAIPNLVKAFATGGTDAVVAEVSAAVNRVMESGSDAFDRANMLATDRMAELQANLDADRARGTGPNPIAEAADEASDSVDELTRVSGEYRKAINELYKNDPIQKIESRRAVLQELMGAVGSIDMSPEKRSGVIRVIAKELEELSVQAAQLASQKGAMEAYWDGLTSRIDEVSAASVAYKDRLRELDAIEAANLITKEKRQDLEEMALLQYEATLYALDPVVSAELQREATLKSLEVALKDQRISEEEHAKAVAVVEANYIRASDSLSEYDKQLKEIRATIDPVTAAQMDFAKEMAAVKELIGEGFTDSDYAEFLRVSKAHMNEQIALLALQSDGVVQLTAKYDPLIANELERSKALLEIQRIAETSIKDEALRAQVIAEATAAANRHYDLVEDKLKGNIRLSEAWSVAWNEAIRRIDTAFADLWTSAFEGMDSFEDAIKDMGKRLAGELAHALITKPLVAKIGEMGTPSTEQAGGVFSTNIFNKAIESIKGVLGKDNAPTKVGPHENAASSKEVIAQATAMGIERSGLIQAVRSSKASGAQEGGGSDWLKMGKKLYDTFSGGFGGSDLLGSFSNSTWGMDIAGSLGSAFDTGIAGISSAFTNGAATWATAAESLTVEGLAQGAMSYTGAGVNLASGSSMAALNSGIANALPMSAYTGSLGAAGSAAATGATAGGLSSSIAALGAKFGAFTDAFGAAYAGVGSNAAGVSFGSIGSTASSGAAGVGTLAGQAVGGAGMGVLSGSLTDMALGSRGNQSRMMAFSAIGGVIGTIIPGIGNLVGAIIGGAVGAIADNLIGGGEKLMQAGYEFTAGVDGITGQTYKKVRKYGSMMSSSVKTTYKAMEEDDRLLRQLNRTFMKFTTSLRELAEGLEVGTEAIDEFQGTAVRVKTVRRGGRKINDEKVQAMMEQAMIDMQGQQIEVFAETALPAGMLDLLNSFKMTGKEMIELNPLLNRMSKEWRKQINFTEEYIQAFYKLAALQTALLTVPSTAGLEAYQDSQKTATERYHDMAEAALDLAKTFDGSLESIVEVSDAFVAQRQAAVDLAMALHSASDEISGMIDNTRESIRMALMTEEQQYDYLRTQQDQLFAQLQTESDPGEILRLTTQLNDIVGQAFGMLQEDQQQAMGPEFLQFLDELDEFTQNRIGIGLDELDQGAEEINDRLGGVIDLNPVVPDETVAQNAETANTFREAATTFGQAVNRFVQLVNDAGNSSAPSPASGGSSFLSLLQAASSRGATESYQEVNR